MSRNPIDKEPRKPEADGYRYYGRWGGNPKGTREDLTRCAESVYCGETRMSHQCGRKRGHGKDGLWCKQHSPEAEQAKADAWNKKYNHDNAVRSATWAEPKEIEAALVAIAKGHNDPRTLAKETFQKIIDRRKELGLDVEKFEERIK